MEIGGSLCYSKLRATEFHTRASLRILVWGSGGFQTDVLHDDGVVRHEYRLVLEVKKVVVVNHVIQTGVHILDAIEKFCSKS